MELNKYAQQQIDLIEEKCKTINPLVVISCLTYNHEAYLRDALEGFVMQKTDFPFVAIVHEDASTDRTAELLREYSERYPDKILPIFEKENQYSKKNGSLTKIMNHACKSTGAKYVAICEGDDYWTDPLKLQKQVDFMESHIEYSMCFHTVEIKHQGTTEIKSISHKIKTKDYYAEEVLYDWIIPSCSALLRREFVFNVPKHKDFLVGDNVLWASCLSKGKIKGFDEKMGVYRRVDSGWTAKSNKSKKDRYESGLKWIGHYKAMIKSFPTINKDIFDKKIVENMASITRNDIFSLKKQFFYHFKNYFQEYGFNYLRHIFIPTHRNKCK